MKNTTRVALAVVLLASCGLAALNWQSLFFASAVASSGQRPALLRDAEWDKPETAKDFRQRFASGSSEEALLQWLHAESFHIDRQAQRATLKINGVPCSETAAVTWKSKGGTIKAADANVSEAGCL
jgi:hypothetical protein